MTSLPLGRARQTAAPLMLNMSASQTRRLIKWLKGLVSHKFMVSRQINPVTTTRYT